MMDEKRQLVVALERFETQLETPVVPGELTTWLQMAEKALQELFPALQSQIENRHEVSIQAIAEQDPGLLSRVERLKNEDREILVESKRLFKMISPMAQHGERLEPDEQRATHAVEKIVDEGLNFVLRIRKQEVAIDTWFTEAFDRDRGIAD